MLWLRWALGVVKLRRVASESDEEFLKVGMPPCFALALVSVLSPPSPCRDGWLPGKPGFWLVFQQCGSSCGLPGGALPSSLHHWKTECRGRSCQNRSSLAWSTALNAACVPAPASHSPEPALPLRRAFPALAPLGLPAPAVFPDFKYIPYPANGPKGPLPPCVYDPWTSFTKTPC